MNIRYFIQSGLCHDRDITACQDVTHFIQDEHRSTIVLCDGAGSSPYGSLAAETTCQIIAEHLHKYFETYLYESVNTIKREIVNNLETKLTEMARKNGIHPRLMATTLLAASMDDEGRFVCLHLGDGNILWNVKEEPGLQIISSAKNISSSRTYLTMNCRMFYYLKFYRWTKPEAKRIILMTDGMNLLKSSLTEESFTEGNLSDLNKSIHEANSFDDLSYILCEL